MGGLIPLGDASRRPVRVPLVTGFLIVVNVVVFIMELTKGDAFVMQWSAIPAQITSGHHWITILTAMFMHASWSHIIGNMIFLWAFSPEIEDAMGRGKYLVFYLLGGMVAMLAQVLSSPHSTVPNLGASGAIAAVMGAFIVTYPRDRIRVLLFIFIFFRVTFIPAVLLIGFWFLTQLFNAGQVAHAQTGGVAYLAHVGGFIFGAAFGRLFENSSRDAAVSTI
ncbi:MAG TPA: rhomboid family intramembrane serine protease [Candidatus Aquilonibacter sp.]|nr:rhomboid family intramembrane serine protease [Candidatus Aquilonibacter sp.]